MHRSVKLVGPRGVGENSSDARFELSGGLFFSDCCDEAAHDFVTPRFEILGAVIQHLGAVMRGRLGPCAGFSGCFDCIANIFAISERSFAQEAAVCGMHFHAVAGIRTCLLPADVKLYSAIDSWSAGLRRILIGSGRMSA